MKIKHVFVLAVFSTIISQSNSFAQSTCSTTITFKWKQGDKEGKEIEEHWTTLHAKGATEEEAKVTMRPLIDQNQKAASDQCRNAHENLSGCMAARYLTIGSSISALSFQARKQMEDAVKVDCEKIQGKCLGVNIAEIKCVTEVPKVEEAATEGDKSAEGDKKDDKKADKKEEKKK